MKVLWLTNIPSPYRVAFFNELGKRCDLTVLFEKRSSSERDSSWQQFDTPFFTPIFLKGPSAGVAEAFCPTVVKHLKKGVYDRIVISNFSDPTGWLAIAMLKLKKMEYILESDGGFAGSGKGPKEAFKRFLIAGACQYFSTAEVHDVYYKTYGATSEQIVRYPFTSLHEIDIVPCVIEKAEKHSIKRRLGIPEKQMILAVGQFIPRKGYDVLLKACARLKENIGCYIVGGTPPQEYLNLAEKLNLTNVHFVEFKRPEELKQYYLAADAFAHPTREDIWGLVINEAMAKGLPVVTTDKCIAGLQLIKDGENGFIVKSEDPESLAVALNEVLQNKGFAVKALESIREYTVEEMANCHLRAWTAVAQS